MAEDNTPKDYPSRENLPDVTPRGSIRVRTTHRGRIGLGVRVSARFQIFALRMLPHCVGRYLRWIFSMLGDNLGGKYFQGNH